jgi:hypothetical protein
MAAKVQTRTRVRKETLTQAARNDERTILQGRMPGIREDSQHADAMRGSEPEQHRPQQPPKRKPKLQLKLQSEQQLKPK